MRHLFHLARPVTQRIASSKPLDRSSSSSYVSTWPDQAPDTWQESGVIIARTVRYLCRETFGKWKFRDLAFGLKYHMKFQGLVHQLDYNGKRSVRLKDGEILPELIYLLKYLKLCFYFSKKSFSEFLQYAGYCKGNILFQNSKAKLMRPAFTIVRDEDSKCFLIIIRGATSSRDKLTAATSGEVPFRKLDLNEGGIANLVTGHVHCGMLASAKWIAKYAVPCLNKAKENSPHYEIKIMGHSMGAGIAAILTQILREKKEFASCICLAFAPAACMTWDLAESGKEFITSLVNKTDAVPSFSRISAEILRTEVARSSRRNEMDKSKTHLNIFYKLFNRQLNPIRFCSSRPNIVDADMALCSDSETNTCQGGTSNKSTQSHSSNIDLKFPNNVRYFTTFRRNPKFSTSKISTDLHFGPPFKDNKQLYPPGRILHMVSLEEGKFGICENPRDIYGKIRLASKMIRDHYMPNYIETLELLIDELGK